MSVVCYKKAMFSALRAKYLSQITKFYGSFTKQDIYLQNSRTDYRKLFTHYMRQKHECYDCSTKKTLLGDNNYTS